MINDMFLTVIIIKHGNVHMAHALHGVSIGKSMKWQFPRNVTEHKVSDLFRDITQIGIVLTLIKNLLDL